MSKKKTTPKNDMIAYLRRLSHDAPFEPFTAEEIAMILSRHGRPQDLSQYQNPNLVPLLKKFHAEQLARAEANFREPSRMHALGELLESTLVLKDLFISQLAEQSGISVEEIEAYVEKRLPAQPLRDDQLARLAEVSGLALAEIRRIATETRQRDQAERSTSKPARPYRFDPSTFGAGMIRDSEDKPEP